MVPNYILRTSIVQNSYRQKSHKIGLIIGSPVKIHENIQNCNEIQFKDYIKVTGDSKDACSLQFPFGNEKRKRNKKIYLEDNKNETTTLKTIRYNIIYTENKAIMFNLFIKNQDLRGLCIQISIKTFLKYTLKMLENQKEQKIL